MKINQWIFLGLIVLSILQWIHFYPLLPDRIAHQFDTRGNPVNWSSKQDILWMMIAVKGIILLIFAVLPATANRIPRIWWNLPNRDYWLADERKKETISTVKNALTWLGCVVLLFIMLTNQSVFNYNIPESNRIPIPDMVYIFICFLLFIGGWIWMLLRCFYKNS